ATPTAADAAKPAAAKAGSERRAIVVPKFRDPTDAEADTASPEHEEYLKAKAAWEKEQKEKLEREEDERIKAEMAAASAVEAEQDAPADSGDSPELAAIKAGFKTKINEMLTGATISMNELWGRAYGCKAASLRIRKRIDDLVAKIDSFSMTEESMEAMKRAGDFSIDVKSEYDAIKASEDVSKVQKAGNYIRQRGASTIQQSVNQMLIAVKEMKREIEKLEEAERERKRLEELARIKAQTIEEDNKKIREKFDSLVEAGTFRQLNWSGAIRQLQAMHDEFKYSESQLLARTLIKKVAMMATVQEVFIANCKDLKFQRSKLAGYTITEINEKDGLKLLKPDGKTPMKMTWVKFYQQYHGNLNELIVRFIEKGKDVSKLKDGKRLSLQPWADAMMGAALTMQIICGDDPTAAGRAEQIAKAAVKALPEYLKHAQEIFPDFTFDETPEE
ncbi:MAG: hypothetical protein II488_04350, partial [Firmicutes bacterium]|nr:hypothetical protein [Bacillota bacterium]